MADRKMEYALETAQRRLASDVEELINYARSAGQDLMRLANQLEADPDETFNTLGVIQARGSNIDRLCALVGAGRRVVEDLS